MKQMILVFVLEGISIGFVASSMTILSTIWVNEVEEERKKLLILWMTNLLIALTAHVIAESFRHDRILGMVNKVSHINLRKNLRKSFDSKMNNFRPHISHAA